MDRGDRLEPLQIARASEYQLTRKGEGGDPVSTLPPGPLLGARRRSRRAFSGAPLSPADLPPRTLVRSDVRDAGGQVVAVRFVDAPPYGIEEACRAAALQIRCRAARQDTGWRRVTSRFANGIRNWLTREDIQDTGCPLKVLRAEAVRSLRPFDGMHRFLPTLLRLEGFAVVEVPVRHAPRTAGSSKYGTWDRAFRGLRDALGVRWLQDRHLRWRLR